MDKYDSPEILLYYRGDKDVVKIDEKMKGLARICLASFIYKGRFEAVVDHMAITGKSIDLVLNPSIKPSIKPEIKVFELDTGTIYFDAEDNIRILVYQATQEEYERLVRGERPKLSKEDCSELATFLKDTSEMETE